MKQLPISTWSVNQLQFIYHEAWVVRLFKDVTYREIAEHINPDMADWYLRSDPELSGRQPNTGIRRYDTTAEESSNLCAEGIEGYAFGRDIDWFRMAYDDGNDDRASELFLQSAEQQMYRQLARSPFYDEARLFVRCLLDFGTAVMWRNENTERGFSTYRTQHLARTYLLENQYLDVDVCIRDIWLSPQSAEAKFGYDALPPQIQQARDLNITKRWKFIQFNFPRGRFNLDMTEAKPWIDIVVPECAIYMPVRLSGFDRRPHYVARYNRSYNEGPWGQSAPGMLQLSNIKQLNGMVKEFTRLVQRYADPTVKATDGMRGKIKRVPGGNVYVPAGNDYQLERAEGNPQWLEARIGQLQTTIRNAYNYDFFLILTNNIEKITHSTATGVQGLMGEKAALLSAFFSRLQYEFHEPLLQDLFMTELLAGRLGAPPASATRREWHVDFVSPLFQMQKQHLVLNNTMNALVQIGNLVQMQISSGQPADVLDNFNLSAFARKIAKTYNVDEDTIRSMVEVAMIRKGRAMQAQEQAAAQSAETQSKLDLARAKTVAAVNKAGGTQPLPGSGAQEAQARAAGGTGVPAPTAVGAV